jgi:hypothetical protein
MKKAARLLLAFLGLLILGEIGDLAWLGYVRATVTSAQSSVVIGGTGSITNFTFPFIGVAPNDITVIYTDANGNQTTLTPNTQYTLTLTVPLPGAIWGLGGSVTYPLVGSPIASGTTITIARTLPYLQTVSSNQGQAFPTAVEAALDLLSMQIQQLDALFGRGIAIPVSDSCGSLGPLPAAAQRANQILAFDGTGCNPIAVSALPSGTVSSAMQPVVNAGSLALGRAAFGLGSFATENLNGGTCGGSSIQDDGSAGGTNGVGWARVVLSTVSDATNQSVTCAFHLTQRAATGAITYTLPRASTTLFNGFGFWIYALPSGGPVTVTPNASDNFVGQSGGASITLQPGTWLWLSTNAASSATWYAATWNPSARITLSGNVTYYVNASASPATCGVTGALTCGGGSDTTGNGTQTSPWQTLQHGVNFIIDSVDIAGQGVTVDLAHGSSTNYQLACVYGPFLGTSVITIVGDRSSITAVTVVDPSSGYGLQIKDGCTLDYDSIGFADASTNDGAGHIIVGGTGNAGHLDYTNVTLGSMTLGTQMTAGNLGSIAALGPLIIGGNAPLMLSANGGGKIDFDVNNVTIASARAYSTGIAYVTDGGIIGATTGTFTGAGVSGTTGLKCIVSGVGNFGSIDPNTIFPGSTSCVSSLLVGATRMQFQNLATYPACGASTAGAIAAIKDSNTVTWGATIAGGSSSPVLGLCDGANYTVFAK